MGRERETWVSEHRSQYERGGKMNTPDLSIMSVPRTKLKQLGLAASVSAKPSTLVLSII